MPTETRDHDPYWGRMFRSSAELEALKEAAAEKVRNAYDATTRAIADGLHHLGGERDAPVDKFKAGLATEMQKQAAPASQGRPAAAPAPVQSPKLAAARADGAGIVMDTVAAAEVKGHPVRYDTTYGFGTYDPPGFDKPITQMTLDELTPFQDGLRARSGGHSPVGKYQVTPGTMGELRGRMKLSGQEIYGPELQERLGRERLMMAGYDAFIDGRISLDQFQDRLAGAWSSIPMTNGKSRYGDPLGVSSEDLRAALLKAKEEADRNRASGQRRTGAGWR